MHKPADPLLDCFTALRAALAPLGVRVEPIVLQVWRDTQAHRQEPLIGCGEFDPALIAELERAVALIRRSTADEPGAG